MKVCSILHKKNMPAKKKAKPKAKKKVTKAKRKPVAKKRAKPRTSNKGATLHPHCDHAWVLAHSTGSFIVAKAVFVCTKCWKQQCLKLGMELED
jgi:hypothetical protein